MLMFPAESRTISLDTPKPSKILTLDVVKLALETPQSVNLDDRDSDPKFCQRPLDRVPRIPDVGMAEKCSWRRLEREQVVKPAPFGAGVTATARARASAGSAGLWAGLRRRVCDRVDSDLLLLLEHAKGVLAMCAEA